MVYFCACRRVVVSGGGGSHGTILSDTLLSSSLLAVLREVEAGKGAKLLQEGPQHGVLDSPPLFLSLSFSLSLSLPHTQKFFQEEKSKKVQDQRRRRRPRRSKKRSPFQRVLIPAIDGQKREGIVPIHCFCGQVQGGRKIVHFYPLHTTSQALQP